jgi:hypothetical protein
MPCCFLRTASDPTEAPRVIELTHPNGATRSPRPENAVASASFARTVLPQDDGERWRLRLLGPPPQSLRSTALAGNTRLPNRTVAACTLLPVTFLLLSRPKGRNSGGEELGRGRWETVSPQGRQNLYGRLARLPRAAPFKRPNRI